jgi:hypothetical protein
MDREFYAREQRRQRTRDAKAVVALALWGGGCYLLYLAWSASAALADPLNDVLGTAIYLITFFYLFAFWPILALVDRLFGRLAPEGAPASEERPQDGGSPTSPAASPLLTSRNPAGSASSSGEGS